MKTYTFYTSGGTKFIVTAKNQTEAASKAFSFTGEKITNRNHPIT